MIISIIVIISVMIYRDMNFLVLPIPSHYCKFSDRLVDTEEEISDESPGLNPPEEKKGHPLPCSSDCCTSRLRILRAAAVHYPILRTLLTNIYRARRSHNGIRDIESGLSEGSISSLKNILKGTRPFRTVG